MGIAKLAMPQSTLLRSTLALIVGFAAVKSATADYRFGRVVKARPLPDSWEEAGDAAASDQVQILVTVKPAASDGPERIARHAMASADPDNGEHYGKHLTQAQIEDLRAPEPETLHQVLQYFSGQSIKTEITGGNGDTILARGTVTSFSKAFSTSFRVVRRIYAP